MSFFEENSTVIYVRSGPSISESKKLKIFKELSRFCEFFEMFRVLENINGLTRIVVNIQLNFLGCNCHFVLTLENLLNIEVSTFAGTLM